MVHETIVLLIYVDVLDEALLQKIVEGENSVSQLLITRLYYHHGQMY